VRARLSALFEAYTASCTIGTGVLSWGKAAGRGFDHIPPSNVEVKEKVEL
jgi:hypothetical protein